MNKSTFAKNSLSMDEIMEVYAQVWGKCLTDHKDLLEAQNRLLLIDNDNWKSLDADNLFDLCIRWKRNYLRNKPGKNTGSLEWLLCVLRHNATNYDHILESTSERHAWAPGFGSLLRLQADFLIISYLQNFNLYDDLIKKCQNEWMWRNFEK